MSKLAEMSVLSLCWLFLAVAFTQPALTESFHLPTGSPGNRLSGQLSGASSCTVLVLHLETQLRELQIVATAEECPPEQLWVSLAVHTERDAAVQIAQLLHEQQCRIEHLVEPLTSLGFLAAHAGAQAPYGASAAPPGVALLRLNSSCPELRVGVWSRALLRQLMAWQGRQLLRRQLLPGNYSGNATGGPPPAPAQAQDPAQTGLDISNLGNRSVNGTAGGPLLLNSDQTPPGPAAAPATNSSTVSCCCSNATYSTIILPADQAASIPGCCCGNPSVCCPSSNGPFVMCRLKDGYCFVTVLVSSLVVAIVFCLGFSAYFIGSHCRRRRQHRIAAARLASIQLQPAVQLVPKPTLPQPAAMEGQLRECPVCWEKIQANAAWVLFICRHGVCADCYAKLLLHPASALCPLCRMPLMQPRVTAAAPGQ